MRFSTEKKNSKSKFFDDVTLKTKKTSPVQKKKLKSRFKDPVLPIMHCGLAIIGGHFLEVEKSEN